MRRDVRTNQSHAALLTPLARTCEVPHHCIHLVYQEFGRFINRNFNQGKSWLPLPLLHQFVLFLPVSEKFLRHVNNHYLVGNWDGKEPLTCQGALISQSRHSCGLHR